MQANHVTPSAEQRHAMVAEAAYYLAEQRGFQGDEHMTDWLRAEMEIDRLLEGAPVKKVRKVSAKRKGSTNVPPKDSPGSL